MPFGAKAALSDESAETAQPGSVNPGDAFIFHPTSS